MGQIHTSDLAEEASVRSDDSGVTCTRRLLVIGLSGSASARLFEAINTVGIPRRGDPHPDLPGILVSSVDGNPAPGSVGNAIVVVTYSAPSFNSQAPSPTGQPTYRFTATVQDEETSEDKDGNQMILTHTKVSVVDGNNVSQVLDPQPGKVSVQRPMEYFFCDRPEPLPFNYNKCHDYMGRVNNVPWRNFPARTVLCTNIEVEEAGDRANVSYQFQIKPVGTWDVRLTYIDPAKGSPVENPIEGEGIKNFKVYPEADFNQLNV